MVSPRTYAWLRVLVLLVFAGVSSFVTSGPNSSAQKHGLPVAVQKGSTTLMADGGGPLPSPMPIPRPWSGSLAV